MYKQKKLIDFELRLLSVTLIVVTDVFVLIVIVGVSSNYSRPCVTYTAYSHAGED